MIRSAVPARAGSPTPAGVGAIALVATVLAIGLWPAGAGAQLSEPRPDARAWLLIDARDGERLADRAADRSMPIASATKLMTAFVALERLPLERMLSAPAYPANPVESVLGLERGERISVDDLLVALLLASANDAAVTLAEGASGSVRRFVRAMNLAAGRLRLTDSEFANPIGLDDPANHSSARDLAALTLELREDPRFRRIVARRGARLRSGERVHRVRTRNTLLLADDRVDGVKTGHTVGAGYVLVASAEHRGVELISVVLGAPSESARDSSSRQLLDYGFELYEQHRAIRDGQTLARAAVAGADEELALIAARGIRVPVRADQRVEVSVDAPAAVDGPLARGERLGTATVRIEGEPVARVPLIAERPVAAASSGGGVGVLPAALLAAGSGVILIGMFASRRRRPGPPRRTVEERMRSREQRSHERRRDGDEVSR